MRKTISRAIRNVPSSISGAVGTGNGNATAWVCSMTPISGAGAVSSVSRRAASYRWTTSLLLTTSTCLGLSLDLADRSVNVVSKAGRINPRVPVIPRLRSVRVGSSTSISGWAVLCTFATRTGSVRIVTVTPHLQTGRPRHVCW